jgi:exodeoxyribonuclease-5
MTANAMTANTINLSKKQHQAVQMILDWRGSDRQCFVLGGYAGSGKSTLARRIAEKLGGTFCAYTAKAAYVLREKGIPACTIHSLIYQYEGKDPQTKKLIWSLRDQEDGNFLIVDEYSMIDGKILADLQRQFKKILFLGDPAQLPPIHEGRQILEPDFFLDEIHRQAEGNPIIKWAHEIRQGHIPYNDMNDNDQFVVKRVNDLTDEEMTGAEQIIVGKNKTVKQINDYMRELYGFSDQGNIPVRGDKLICLQNNHQDNLFNGYVFEATRNARSWNPETEQYNLVIDNKEYAVWDGDILGKDNDKYNFYSKLQRVNFAYAVTCHKSQGSEYDSVIIINEAWGNQKLNWLYTAVTRGKKKVILAHTGGK